jgi:hypothetical protein
METQNITLAVPKNILLKAKQIAVERKISISKLLTHALSEMVLHEENQLIVRSPRHVREGWEREFRLMAERKEDNLIDGDI